MGRAALPRLRISRKVRGLLREIVRRQTAPARMVVRARIILMSGDGLSAEEIGRRLSIHPKPVPMWRKRFKFHGLRGLEDDPRSGRPSKLRDRDRVEVLGVACRAPQQLGQHRTLWTCDSLAKYLVESDRVRAISKSSVHRILQEAELRPHRVRMWCTSNDPNYDRKVADVTAIYLAPPRGEPVLSIDEKSQIQILSRRVGLRRARAGDDGQQESDYKRHGTRCLMACFDVRTGQVLGRMMDQRRSVEFLAFLDEVARAYPRGRVHLVMDNLNTHFGPAIDAWNARHGRRFVFHYTPFHASWLNQVEIFFSILTRRVLRHGEFTSSSQLDGTILGFLGHWNRKEAHPFNWTYEGKRERVVA